MKLEPTSIDIRNELAVVLMENPAGMAEAYRLIKKSLEEAPDQPGAAEMQRTLTQLEAEGYGKSE